MRWFVEFQFQSVWTTMGNPEGFGSREDAEWAIAKWKQANRCTGDSMFRTVQMPGVRTVADAESGELHDEYPF